MREIRFRVLGIDFKLHPALLMSVALSITSGEAVVTLFSVLSLLLHETGHMAAARLMHVKVLQMDLMPFGAAARIENPWSLRPGQLLVTALAGPAISASMAVLFFELGMHGRIDAALSARMALMNCALTLFNLLPALPLDGGRAVYGLLAHVIGRERSVKIGVRAGYVLSAMIICVIVLYALRGGTLHVMLLICAVYLIAGASAERAQAGGAGVMSMVDRARELRQEGTLPIRWLAAEARTSAEQVIAGIKPRTLHRVAVYDHDMNLMGILEEETLLKAALGESGRTMEAILHDSGRSFLNIG